MAATFVALAIVLLLTGALLAMPVRLLVRVERSERLRALLRLRWLFGLVDIEKSWPGPPRPPRPERPEKPKARDRKRTRGSRRILALVRTPGLLGRTLRLLNDLRRKVTVEAFHLQAEFGLDDPADTGRVYGALAPILVAAAAGGMDVRCDPNFTSAVLQGAAGGSLRVRPLSVMGTVAAFVLSRPFVRALIRFWRARR
jgi:hypothetical protein